MNILKIIVAIFYNFATNYLTGSLFHGTDGMKQEDYLEFEKIIAEVDSKIEAVRHMENPAGFNVVDEITRLEKKLEKNLTQIYAKLTPWQKTLVARHPNRPHALDYINMLFTDFIAFAGDGLFGEDEAVVGGMGKFFDIPAVVIGLEKGHDITTRMKHNFGMARPEGYRKAARLMRLADKFKLPVITFVDTAGAFPGVDAEERGQAEAIAKSIETGLNLRVPFVSVIIGEGGSGGALALAAANRVLMLEHSVYSVISPEGCASILWRDGTQAQKAAEALCLTAQDLKRFGVVDEIIPEKEGGAHRFRAETVTAVGQTVLKHLNELRELSCEMVYQDRQQKFLKMTRLN